MASRITSNMIVRNYRNSLRTNLGHLTTSNQKLSTQRTFNKASENVNEAARALRIRKMLQETERYEDSVKTISNRFDAADSALRALSGLYDQMTGLITQALNGTYTEYDRSVMAQEVEMLREEALSLANTKFGDKYLFCSAGNADGSAPFSVANGKLIYNGNATPVDSMIAGADNKPANADGSPIDYNGVNYVDIGLGLTVNSAGMLHVDTKSVFAASFSGVELFGYGMSTVTNSNGEQIQIPSNFYGLFSTMVDSLYDNDTVTLNSTLTVLEQNHEHILMSLAELGSNHNFLDDMASQISDNKLSLQELQNDIEAVDLSEEIMYNTQFEMAWTVSLQLGSSLLPQSIFDFLR